MVGSFVAGGGFLIRYSDDHTKETHCLL